MLRKMLLVTPEYFERLRNDKTEIEDTKKVARLLNLRVKNKKQKSSHMTLMTRGLSYDRCKIPYCGAPKNVGNPCH
jgi:hypothetical protein